MSTRLILLATCCWFAGCSTPATSKTSTPAGAESSLAQCSDKLDNDKDGFTDCADQDCAKSSGCIGNLDASVAKDGGADADGGATEVDGTTEKDATPEKDAALDNDVGADKDTAADVGADTVADVVADAGGTDAGGDIADTAADSVDASTQDSGSDAGSPADSVDAGADNAQGTDAVASVDIAASVDAGADVAAACSAGTTKRCWVECGLTIPAGCFQGDIPPRIPGLQACQGGQWAACETQMACTGLVGGCNPGIGKPADKADAKWQCLDGTQKQTYFGCSQILGVACQGTGFFINWPIHECTDFCPDEACAQKGAVEPCEVHCDTPDGPVHPGTRTCQDPCGTPYWSQCFSKDACKK